MAQYRQGDVFLVAVDSVPSKATQLKRRDGKLILAEGEATGHAHAIKSPRARLLEHAGLIYLVLLAKAKLLHEEHAPIELPPGQYLVKRQREYTPERIRNVAD